LLATDYGVICHLPEGGEREFDIRPSAPSFSLHLLGESLYPQVIEEWKAYGHFTSDRNETELANPLECHCPINVLLNFLEKKGELVPTCRLVGVDYFGEAAR
jgi:hypothetical protein